ncbi:protein disulfide oxidoreductase [Marinimicrobium alkaliphilum]|uniref:protein disulfide oxidoreductase n=1 Tax=Marinimicrobium alkaliphilum TaxID=2202654 RepID=UPI000DBA351E|nr:protein disulfide oxidoreductase [Marinimicrobium alkaliphilum]
MSVKAKVWSGLRQVALLVLMFVVITTLMDHWRGRQIPDQVIPDQDLALLDDTPIDLLALSHEQPVMVYFWATWCGVCRFVSPSVSWMAGGDHTVVSVAIASGDNARVQAYQDAKGYGFDTINDPRNLLARAWGISATPTILILKDGEVASSTTGFTTPVGLWLRMRFQ